MKLINSYVTIFCVVLKLISNTNYVNKYSAHKHNIVYAIKYCDYEYMFDVSVFVFISA